MLQTVREAGVGAVKKGSILLGKGRALPRSSPASVLLSKSQKMTSSGSKAPLSPLTSSHHHSPTRHSLPLSPTKQSPGSHSESSPSPTSKYINVQSHFHSAITVTTSSSSGALTLTPSTTSSSLTSVTTPNSLTPVSSTAKSITPATTSSNYSLTSEFSTTLVSPTPAGKYTDSPSSGNDIFPTVSVRSRVSALEVSPIPGQSQPSSHGQSSTSQGQDYSCQASSQAQTQDLVDHPQGQIYSDDRLGKVQGQLNREASKPQPIPPSPFPIRRFTGPGPGHVERRHSIDERERRRLPSLPSQQPHPLIHQYSLPNVLPPPTGDRDSEDSLSEPVTPPEIQKESNGHGNYDCPIGQQQKQVTPPPPPPKPKSKSGSVDSIASNSSAPSPPQSNSNGSASSSPSWATTVVAVPSPLKSSTSVTTENGQPQSPGTLAKVTSPSPVSTPPPVPPRLDRRPSQPSPTSSPPAIPPPVPPRLGRAAPVRTPSCDSRESFEVDCYTIKEENGEEDYLT